jgi:hypothetical protein
MSVTVVTAVGDGGTTSNVGGGWVGSMGRVATVEGSAIVGTISGGSVCVPVNWQASIGRSKNMNSCIRVRLFG